MFRCLALASLLLVIPVASRADGSKPKAAKIKTVKVEDQAPEKALKGSHHKHRFLDLNVFHHKSKAKMVGATDKSR
jgi:hypothetical protein